MVDKDYVWRVVQRSGKPNKKEIFISVRVAGLKLSVPFCRQIRMQEKNYTHCEVRIDDHKMAILLHFHTAKSFDEHLRNSTLTDGWYDIIRDGGPKPKKENGPITIIQCGVVTAQPWLKAVCKQENFRKKRFSPIATSDPDKWIVQVMPGFTNRTDAHNLQMKRGSFGIYCYLSAANDILYIGQGDLHQRFVSHAREKDIPAAYIAYTIVNDEDMRKKAERYHLEIYENEFGKLPPFNRYRGYS